MNTRRLFKVGVVSFILLFVGVVYIVVGPSEESHEDHSNTLLLYGQEYQPAVEVLDPLPRKPVQEYEVE